MTHAHVHIIACGGTIAGKADSEKELIGYKAGELTIEELLQSVPEVTEYADITGEQFCNMDSTNMTEDLWLRLAQCVEAAADRADVDGIVITHGTDTMEETAYFLNLVVHSRKPIVMVGSMRPATALSADGPLNLLDAVRIAACRKAGEYGVLVAMNGRICGARSVEKTDTTHVDTFRSRQMGYMGIIQNGIPCFYQHSLRRHTYLSQLSCQGITKLPAVCIVYCYVGMSPALVRAAAASGVQGIVTAGLGHGKIPEAVLKELKTAAQQGIVTVCTSRTLGGIVSTTKDDSGFFRIAGDNLPAHKAKIVLQLALLQTRDPQALQQFFDLY